MPPSVDAPPDLSGLLELSRIENLDLKPVILRVQTDLFVRAPNRDRTAVEIFESLACGLIPTVDEETARVVAGKLAAFPETPPAVLEALALRGGAARDAIVERAPALSQRLIEAALADGSDIAGRIAARAGLSRESVDELSREGRPEIDEALAANLGITLRGAALARLIGRGRGAAGLARLLLVRPDVSAADLAPLYLHADPMRRTVIGRTVEATAALRPCPPPPRGLGETLTALSAARDVPAFVAALADGLGVPRDFLTVVADAGGRYDLLTLGLRAAGLHEEEAVYIFLTLNQGVARSAERVADLVRLFRTVSRPAARDLIGAILDRPLPERGRSEAHQPLHGPEAKLRQGGERMAAQRPPLPLRARVAVGGETA
ncbi:DUF2336 domain-containing protein [Methylobacterium mesophilicum SR1.6/6]|uniref:DUF2336 domain-containing protein n=1 Tax=Methylobacterium mesophilicum SR1.6/6 TaxID=908290 RepID=A0A6B9FUH2_9HYPH|nr:hypothetical protein [Methylobacterium mesophilicum]QGY04748.1 DUF2336 domain-containing protein [Methylobacterium mesophilicum SR1.6/6]